MKSHGSAAGRIEIVAKNAYSFIIVFMRISAFGRSVIAKCGFIRLGLYCAIVVLAFRPIGVLAQEKPSQPIEVEDLSLEQLLNAPVSVTTRSAMSKRDAPGIITLITREEILASGARDLIDVLRMVPGIEFGIDVKGVSGLGIRGIWALEGKILVLWDGLEMQEDLFGSLQLGSHYPVDLIERIEVIRGPGSAVYGGNAELGVINIISRQAAALEGAQADFNLGLSSGTLFRQNASLAIARTKNDVRLDLSLFAGTAVRSDQLMKDYHPNNPYHSYSLTDQSTITPRQLNIGLQFQGITSRLFIDHYTLLDRTHYGLNLPSAVPVSFRTTIFDISRRFDSGRRLSLTPRYTFKRNAPWETREADYEPPVYQDKWTVRHTASLTVDYKLGSNHSLKAGVEYFRNTGYADEKTYFSRDPAKKSLSFGNFSVFGQGLFALSATNLTVGARYDHNSLAGAAFVPRLALTRAIGRFHFKALASLAFRSPNIENLSRYASTPLTPERTSTYELEAGLQFTERLAWAANIFHIVIRDPIIYAVDPVMKVSAYHNGTRLGSDGLEMNLLWKTAALTCRLGYSYYQASNNEIADYTVLDDERSYLGFPRHKVCLSTTCVPLKSVSINLSATYLSKRIYDNSSTRQQIAQAPQLLANAFVHVSPVFLDGLSIGLGVYDIGNCRYRFIQPYFGGNAPLPSIGREILLQISYETR